MLKQRPQIEISVELRKKIENKKLGFKQKPSLTIQISNKGVK